MLDVVVHVQVQEPEDRIHEHRAGRVSVVEHVLSQTGVLGDAEEHDEPRAVDRRAARRTSADIDHDEFQIATDDDDRATQMRDVDPSMTTSAVRSSGDEVRLASASIRPSGVS